MTKTLYDLRKEFIWEMYQAVRYFEPFDKAEEVLEQIAKAKEREARERARAQSKRDETQAQRATHRPGVRGGAPTADQEDVPQGKRRCRTCGQVLPLVDFAKSSNHKDGRGYLCRACDRARSRERWARRQAERVQLVSAG